MLIQSYNDICYEIDGLEKRIDDLNRDIEYYQKLLHKDGPKELSGMQYSDMPKGNANYMSLDRIYEYIREKESHKVLVEENLKCKRESKRSIAEILSKMDGIEYQVFYWSRIKGLKLKEVADKLQYSHPYVKEISAKLPTNNLPTY